MCHCGPQSHSSLQMHGIQTFWVRLTIIGIVILFIVYIINDMSNGPMYFPDTTVEENFIPPVDSCNSLALWNQTLDFEDLNWSNETGNPTGCYVVPNIIHYLYFGGTPISYTYMICVLATLKNQKPEKIYFHYDNKTTFSGKYWEVLEKTPGFMDIVEFHGIELPKEVFGQPLSQQWRKWHGSDIMRIKTLMKYGGIFLDNDNYLIRNIDTFRKYEIAMNWDEGQFLASQVIIAHKDARFLKEWLNTYRVYDESKWYYNAGERPTVEVLYKQPQLIHRVKLMFGADTKFLLYMFQQQWSDWKRLYIVHLFSRHIYQIPSFSEKAKYPVEFNETNIAYYPITFRDMAYEVYDVANIKWPKARLD